MKIEFNLYFKKKEFHLNLQNKILYNFSFPFFGLNFYAFQLKINLIIIYIILYKYQFFNINLIIN